MLKMINYVTILGSFLVMMLLFLSTFSNAQNQLINIKRVRDTCTCTLDAAVYNESKKNNSDVLFKEDKDKIKQSPKRMVPLLNNVQWYIECYPFYKRYNDFDNEKVTVMVRATGLTHVRATLSVEGTSYSQSVKDIFIYKLDADTSFEFTNFLTKDQFFDMLNENGTLTIRCDIEFLIPVPFLELEAFEGFNHNMSDFDIVVGEERIKTSADFISLISAVFNETVTNSTEWGNKLRIDNFTIDTVTTAIDMCHGYPFENLTVETVSQVLLFAKEYNIKPLKEKLVELVVDNINVQNFGRIADFVWRNNYEELKNSCIAFFSEKQKEVTKTREFANLDPLDMSDIFRRAFKYEFVN